MSNRSRAAVGVWRARHVRTRADRGYVVYMVFMVALVTALPVARAVWLSATSAEGIALLTSAAAPQVTALVVACLWAGALLWGRDRGPALRPPFPTYALASSDLPRSAAFGGPVVRAGALVTAVCATVAAVVAGSIASVGLADPVSVVAFTAVGAMVGVITTVAWLAGQALPRAAVPLALAIVSVAAFTGVVPVLQPFTPWGWVGIAYPGGGTPLAFVALTAMTAALGAAVPALLDRLGIAELAAQAARWDSASVHAAGMDFSTAAAVYQAKPHRGRRVRAVRPVAGLGVTFLIRDAVGARRTPGRLIVGVLALAGAGALLTLAFASTMPGWLLGAAAGLLLFAGLGPLTDGLRHAASVASDLPLYGIDDAHLLAYHLLFPLAVVTAVLVAAVVVCSALGGIALAAPILSAIVLGVLALMARIGSALKGPLPPVLLAPIPTPMGDLGAAVRVAWALDALLLAAFAGAAAALVFQAPALLIGVTGALLGVGVSRWRQRR